LNDAVYAGKDQTTSPGYLTTMTKAYFKDGSAQNAVQFFAQGI
jgi:hypothetical protein